MEKSFSEHMAYLDLNVLTVDDILRACNKAELTPVQRNTVFQELYEIQRCRMATEYTVEELPKLEFEGRRVFFNGVEKTISDYQAPTGDTTTWQVVLDGKIYNFEGWHPFLLFKGD